MILNTKTGKGTTPLHLAIGNAGQGQVEVVKARLQHARSVEGWRGGRGGYDYS